MSWVNAWSCWHHFWKRATIVVCFVLSGIITGLSHLLNTMERVPLLNVSRLFPVIYLFSKDVTFRGKHHFIVISVCLYVCVCGFLKFVFVGFYRVTNIWSTSMCFGRWWQYCWLQGLRHLFWRTEKILQGWLFRSRYAEVLRIDSVILMVVTVHCWLVVIYYKLVLYS